ncbi:hypothetical protein HanXRQr2_Chr15g0684651 [Helianthus annuus]|uniref:Uncharacterized protein n=1 Tax=Helianthus annuus TaxID=4232 RepID=A0A9K3DYG5_HELAN|nr:hypothetical protein HanXRQr2_Chr15g0684651 [Helianthus annuus]KAJ0450566.1 hypothetical protein HanHA300_Chr15g0557741 [Helianthus annuus]KAJ0454755.1 hypothetical protein HanIR_Chr15g0743671 [Helianthus annuus]KAJ0472418.1 hypothetical protein HanHA89_Chr15g0606851 [Helianthus annuus]KAJ0648019.1 hypothetical protein HanLR1_Chr15g0568211 [Helianthus annuus]
MSMLSENVVAIGGCGEDCVDLNKSNQLLYIYGGSNDSIHFMEQALGQLVPDIEA